MLRKLFTEHPHSVNETYLEHLGMAFYFSCRLIGGGIACLVHGLLPFFFVNTGSKTISTLYDQMVTHRVRKSALGQVGDMKGRGQTAR